MTDSEKNIMRSLAIILDTCLDHLDTEAAKEERRQAGKRVRSITARKRAQSAHAAVSEAFDLLNLPRE